MESKSDHLPIRLNSVLILDLIKSTILRESLPSEMINEFVNELAFITAENTMF